MTIDLRLLTGFVTVVDHGSLGRAAEALHMTQPALSRMIKRLENQLGAPLFDRETTGMALTGFGQALLPRARLLVSDASHLMEDARAMKGLGRGTLRIGAIASVAATLLPLAIVRLMRQAPDIRVQLLEGVEDRLAAALMDGEIDIAIAGEIAQSSQIMQTGGAIAGDDYGVVAAPGHRLAGAGPVTVEQLLDHPWVMPPMDASPRQAFEGVISALGHAPPIAHVETRSISAMKALVAHGPFLAWLPRPVYLGEERAGQLVSLEVPPLAVRRHFRLYRRRHGVLSPAANCLLDVLRQQTSADLPAVSGCDSSLTA